MPSPPYILLIDDDIDDLQMLAEALEVNGVRTSCFESGIGAVLYMNNLGDSSQLPDLIILDYNMPVSNGFEILALIKKDAAIKNIPVIMYSTGLSEDSCTKFEELGALYCVGKSFNYVDFKLQVERFTNLAYSVKGNFHFDRQTSR